MKIQVTSDDENPIPSLCFSSIDQNYVSKEQLAKMLLELLQLCGLKEMNLIRMIQKSLLVYNVQNQLLLIH